MKILLCHNFYQLRGGEDQVFADESWLLGGRGHQVVHFTRHNDDVKQLGHWRTATRTIWSQQTYRELSAMLQQHRPDVMHCTNTFPLMSPAAYYAARAHGVPVVQSLHNYRLHCLSATFLRAGQPCEKCFGRMVAWPGVIHGCYRQSRLASLTVAAMQTVHRLAGTWDNLVDLYVSCSQFARSKFIQAGMDAERIVAKPNFVRPDPGPRRGEGNYVVFVGRLAAEKAPGLLVDAWRRMASPPLLKIVGDGPLRAKIQQAAAGLPIELHGWQPLERVLAMIGDASLLIMSSIWYETFGRTIIEAYATGTPVVVPRLGAMEELVEDGRTGLLFQAGNAVDLAAKVMQLASDPQLRKAMRRAARNVFEQKYTADENYRQLMAIYDRALTMRNSAQPWRLQRTVGSGRVAL